MPIPAGNISTANLDAPDDAPSAARQQLEALIEQFNALIDSANEASGIVQINSAGRINNAILGRGLASGVARLGSTGRMFISELPPQIPSGNIGDLPAGKITEGTLERPLRPPSSNITISKITLGSATPTAATLATGELYLQY